MVAPGGDFLRSARSFLGLVLVALSFLAVPAGASCQVVTSDAWPDVNYTTICVLDQGGFGDGTQTFTHAYVLHASHAVEADPVFDYAHAHVDQRAWTYDDGETRHERRVTDVSVGAFEGVRGVAGTGAQADLDQRDQTAPEDESGACSGIVGRSTCVGASGWLTAQDVARVGVGVYWQQAGAGADCRESYAAYVDAAVIFVPVEVVPDACLREAPFLYDEARFRDMPALP